MNYYEYDPNCDFYLYDDYQDYYFEEPVVQYHLAKKKRHRDKHCVLNKSDDENVSPNQYSKYLVPIFYTPTTVSDISKFNGQIRENIDLYYSDKRNIEKEARLFTGYTQPRYYASTIQEETESSCFESSNMKEDSEDMGCNKPIVINCAKHRTDSPEKGQDCNYKNHKTKKKTKTALNVAGTTSKKIKSKEHRCKSDKLETSNSWTTLLSGSCVTNKETKTIELVKPTSDTVCEDLLVKKSKSFIYLSEKSKTSVKFNVKDESCVKDDSQIQQNDLRAERDTDRNLTASAESNMKNPSYQTISNVQTMAVPNNKTTSEMVGWKNTTMQQESTTETSKVSSNQELKSNGTLPDISDSTDITINTAEYKEFLKTINKTNKGSSVPYYRYPNFNKSTETITTCEKHKVPVNSIDSNDTLYDKDAYAKRDNEEKPYYSRRVNPLIDVPLNISKATLYTPAFFVLDRPKTTRSVGDHIAVSRRSLFVRIFRTVADVITCCQNFAYKYVLRFILFI